MKPQLLLALALVLSGGLSGCATASREVPKKLDLAAYRIEKLQNKNAAPDDASARTEWENFLVFSNSNICVPIARSATIQSNFESNQGFDPASLKLQWLKQDELLLISWTTFRRGSGGYTHDGNVILQIHGAQGRELFRDHFVSVAKGGWASQQFSSLQITYNDNDRVLKFTRRYTAINGDMGAPDLRRPYPFTTTFTNDNEEAGYISKVDTTATWHYQLAGNRLKFLRGSSAVDVGDGAQPIEEIVKGFHITRAALELMNPRIRGESKAMGAVLLDENLKPYEVSSYDGLYGDK